MPYFSTRSPASPQHKSDSQSHSPIKYNRSRRSRSISPVRYARDHRFSSIIRSRRSPSPKRFRRSPPRIKSHRSPSPIRSRRHSNERRQYRVQRDSYSRGGRQGRDRSRDKGSARDHYSSSLMRHRSRSASPLLRKSSRASSRSPKHYKGSKSPRSKRLFQSDSRSPRHHREIKSSPVRDGRISSSHGRHSRSRSAEKKNYSIEKEAGNLEKLKLELTKRDRTKKTDEKNPNDAKSSRESKEEDSLGLTSSCISEHVAVLNDQGSGPYKKSKLDERNLSIQKSLIRDLNPIGEERDEIEDETFVVSPDLKSSGKEIISGYGSDIYSKNHEHKKTSDHTAAGYHAENRESSYYEKSSRNYKKHEKLDSATKEREYSHSRDERRASHYSSSRSHRSSRHSDERSSIDTGNQRTKGKSEVEYVKHHRSRGEANESTYSARRKGRDLSSTIALPDGSKSSATQDATQQRVQVVDGHDHCDEIDSVIVKQNTVPNGVLELREDYTSGPNLISRKPCPTFGYPGTSIGADDYVECEEPKLDVVTSRNCNQELGDKANEVKSYDQKSTKMSLSNNHQDHFNNDSRFFESDQKFEDTEMISSNVQYKPMAFGEAENVHLSGFASFRSPDVLKEDDALEIGCLEVTHPQEFINHEPSNNEDVPAQEVM